MKEPEPHPWIDRLDVDECVRLMLCSTSELLVVVARYELELECEMIAQEGKR